MVNTIKLTFILLTLFVAACTMSSGSSMMTLFDGASMDNWNESGNTVWTFSNGYVEGAGEGGFLLSENTYDDFRMVAEFWVDAPANSGIFIRCPDSENIGAETCYEVNIYDQRPDPTYRTGSIVNFAPPAAQINAAGQWNRYEILAQGSRLQIILNGIETVDINDDSFDSGYIALQYGTGVVRFREVLLEEL